MRSRRFDPPEPSVLSHWFGEVAAAACAFEARWTMRALRRVDAALAGRLEAQRALFDTACVTGTDDEVAAHGAAMCRGYAVCVKALAEAEEPDDAYFEGFDAASGLRVLVGPHKATARHVDEGVVHITPDEVAALLASERHGLVGAIMRQFPGAELTEIREAEQAGEVPG